MADKQSGLMQTVILRKRRLSRDFWIMEFKWSPRLAHPAPGQFVMLRTRSTTDPLWRRPFGVHDFRAGRKGCTASLLFQVVGPTTRDLEEREAGESVDMLGPFGRGFSSEGKEHWLVAGGRGIAPLYYFARILNKKDIPSRIMIGGCTAAHVVKAAELRRMGLGVEISTEDGSLGSRGIVTSILEKRLRRLGARRRGELVISACGPEGMLRTVADLAGGAGAGAQLSLDTLMACGQGYCQGCSVSTKDGYRLCCQEGPVFTAEELGW